MRVLTYIALLIPSLVFSQAFQVSFDGPDKAELGEPVTINIRFTFDSNKPAPSFSTFEEGQMLNESLEITKVGETNIKELGPSTDYRLPLTIVSWDTGYQVIPPFRAYYDGDSLFTDAIMLYVPGIEPDISKGPKDIKDIAEDEWNTWDKIVAFFSENWPIIAVVVAVLGGLLLLYLYFFKWRDSISKAKVLLPPHEQAYAAIQKLETKKLWQTGQTKAFYIELTDILRRYLERRFSIQAMEQTTDELLTNLKSTDFDPKSKRELRELLKLADLVKFARHETVPSENENSIDIVRAIVDRTKQIIVETGEE